MKDARRDLFFVFEPIRNPITNHVAIFVKPVSYVDIIMSRNLTQRQKMLDDLYISISINLRNLSGSAICFEGFLRS